MGPLGGSADAWWHPFQIRLLVLWKLVEGEAGPCQLGGERLRPRCNAECRGAPVDIGACDRDLGLHGAGGAVGHRLKRLGQRAGGRQSQPRSCKGIELPLTR